MRVIEKSMRGALAALLHPGQMVVVHVFGGSHAYSKCDVCEELHVEELEEGDPRLRLPSGTMLGAGRDPAAGRPLLN